MREFKMSMEFLSSEYTMRDKRMGKIYDGFKGSV